ncbi:hypothetical protein ANCCAN_26848 [Ancylostoma caninum]|uniref:Uncharacterized protein n=1 Tax=Ancylostoma caninum TaxID=29170 RepID=A0A368F755_ANCCA|nr:hypothetical protein ANCCAN_26848 [Ancylostoma caninum]
MGLTYDPNVFHRKKTVSKAKCYTPNALVPTELLQIRVVILEKPSRTIVRSKIEFELPSDFPLDYILDAVEEKILFGQTVPIFWEVLLFPPSPKFLIEKTWTNVKN